MRCQEEENRGDGQVLKQKSSLFPWKDANKN